MKAGQQLRRGLRALRRRAVALSPGTWNGGPEAARRGSSVVPSGTEDPAPSPELAGARLLRSFAQTFPEAVFIEIGANDGDQLDHLRALIMNGSWSGVMVEPVPYVFEQLKRNYGHVDRVILENAAIADVSGRKTLYYIPTPEPASEAELPPWYSAIGSFSLEHVLKHRPGIPDIDQRVVGQEIECLTFDALRAKHRVEAVDLLLIDTEGYDYEILRHIDFSVHHPILVVYEHRHFDAATRGDCRQMMHEHGYETMEEGHDTWCLRSDAPADLRELWGQLHPVVPGIAAYEENW